MPTSVWVRLDWWMRALHLYTGLFLTPWMAVYATSAFFLQHSDLLPQRFAAPQQRWEVVQNAALPADGSIAGDVEAQARAVLRKLDLDGRHRVLSEENERNLVIYRTSSGGDYRIIWQRDVGRVVVQRQTPFSPMRWLHSLHFARGYDWRYPTAVIWAFSVDAVIASTWFWIVSGVYIWIRRPSKRVLGAVCLLGGVALFAALGVLFSR